MVNGLARGLVVTGLLGVLEVTDVPDEGSRVTVGSRAAAIVLVILIVHDKVLLVLLVEHPSLMSVGSTLIGSDGNQRGLLLVGDIINRLVQD